MRQRHKGQINMNFTQALGGLLLGALLILRPLSVLADPPAAPPEAHIAPFAHDCVAAISYTFDDGLHSQLVFAVPMLEADGFRGTFFVIPSRIPDTEAEVEAQHMISWGSISWERLRQMSAKGHEIGNHTWTHPNLGTLTLAQVREEIEHADRVITEKIGIAPLTVCYPGNGFNDQIKAIALEHHVMDRENLTGFGGPDFTEAWAKKWVDDLIAQKQWGVTMIHVIGTKPDETDPKILKDQMDYAKSRSDAVWVDTFANVARYVKERDAAKVSVTPDGKRKLRVMLDCSLANPPYNVPLTVIVAVPGVRQFTARRGRRGPEMPTKVLPDHIQFEAAPGPDPILIAWK
jgi:peptidoglycan/xylan/chitin deacetylase (PgdA/CDA1 family)